MKVVLIADAAWLRHEAGLLRHLAVGLADEGVRTLAVVPAGQLAGQLTLVGECIDYRSTRRGWLENLRLVRLLRGLREDEELDLIHVLDASLAPAGWWLGKKLELPVVCSCWSRQDVASANRWRSGGSPMVNAVASAALMDEAGAYAAPGVQFELVRPGVISRGDDVSKPLADPHQSLCCLVIAADSPGLAAMLDGVSQVRKRHPQLQLFLYCMRPQQTGRLWQQLVNRDLAGMVSLVGQDVGSQSLLVHSDALLIPQPLSVVRTLVLMEMAAGRPVVAAPDPVADYLIDGRTARLARDWSADDWARCFDEMVNDPESLRRLGVDARNYVREHHGAASFVARMLDVYRTATAAPMPFGQP